MVSDASKKKVAQKKEATAAKRGGKATVASSSSAVGHVLEFCARILFPEIFGNWKAMDCNSRNVWCSGNAKDLQSNVDEEVIKGSNEKSISGTGEVKKRRPLMGRSMLSSFPAWILGDGTPLMC